MLRGQGGGIGERFYVMSTDSVSVSTFSTFMCVENPVENVRNLLIWGFSLYIAFTFNITDASVKHN